MDDDLAKRLSDYWAAQSGRYMTADQVRASMDPPIPPLPGPIRIGTVWWWMPHRPDASKVVRISNLRWNGEEWWVECTPVASTERHVAWNELDRFIEACVFLREG